MSLKPISTIKAPDLISFDRENSAKEIMDRMKLIPGWKDIWITEQHQDASQFVIQTFNYLMEKIANSTNKNLRENFLSDAFSDRAIYANLNQMRVNTIQNKEATVELIGRLETGALYRDLVFERNYQIPTTSINGESITFEIIPRDEATGEYDYLNSVVVSPSTFARTAFRVKAFSGETKQAKAVLSEEDLENIRIKLPFEDIIEGSVQAYYKTGTDTFTKLRKTDKFVVEPYKTEASQELFPNGIPHYIVRNEENGKATLYFGSASFGGAFEEQHIGGTIIVYCRIGGGSSNNVPANHINYRAEIEQIGELPFYINFYNPDQAYGGDDKETPRDAQIFAPLRYGRQGATVLVDDARTRLYRTIVKHEIETPQANEENPKVPILHNYHYLVPQREFDNWNIIPYEPGETIESYIERLFIDLNQFLKIDGANDIPIENEMVYTFVNADAQGDYNFVYTIKNPRPLAGTLSLTAWDYEDDLVDYTKWTHNYYTNDIVLSDARSEHAEILTNPFSAFRIDNGVNNLLKLKLDGVNFVFELSLPTGTSQSRTAIVTGLQAAIKNIIENEFVAQSNFYEYRNFQFFREYNNQIQIRSPRVGLGSSIEILPHGLSTDPQFNLYNTLGLEIKIYRPPRETGIVFRSSSYVHNHGDIAININPDYIENQYKEFEFNSDWEQDTGQEAGPHFELTLTDLTPDKLVQVIPNSNIFVEALKLNEITQAYDVIDLLIYQNVHPNFITIPSYHEGTGAVFDENKIDGMEYNYSEAKLKLAFKDGIAVDIYKQSYPNITRMELWQSILSEGEWIRTGTGPLKIIYEHDCYNAELEEDFETWTQSIFEESGKTSVIKLEEVDLENGNNYMIEVYSSTDMVNKIVFENIDTTTPGTDSGNISAMEEEAVYFQTAIFNFEDTEEQYFQLQFNDGELDTDIEDYYLPGFDEFDKIRITYNRKSYEYITASYSPNPYLPQREAATYLSLLKDKSHKLIGLEHIIKNVDYAPVGGLLELQISPGFSEKKIYDKSFDIIQKYLGYNNINMNHTIGTKIDENLIRSVLLRNLAQDYGLEDVRFIPSHNYFEELTEEEIDNTYFFVPNDIMVREIRQIEEDNAELNGLTSIFQMRVVVIKSGRGA